MFPSSPSSLKVLDSISSSDFDLLSCIAYNPWHSFQRFWSYEPRYKDKSLLASIHSMSKST